MLLIPCPHCGPRPEIEFRHAGEAHLAREPMTADDASWADFLYGRTNARGVVAERWRHVHGCGRFMNALRDSTTDMFVVTYPAGAPRPELPMGDGKDGASAR